MSTLAAELVAFRKSFVSQIPPAVRDAMARADVDLIASGIADRALKAGDRAPDFVLHGVDGAAVSLAERLHDGPVVLSFYRGGWCPYCNLELRGLQAVLPTIAALGASLIAVSPQTPDESLSTAEKNALDFAVLSDRGSAAARRFGLTFDLAEELHPIYAQFGNDLPRINGTGDWVLPMPATYVIGQDGVIRFAFVDPDYRNRLEPSAVIDALCALVQTEAS